MTKFSLNINDTHISAEISDVPPTLDVLQQNDNKNKLKNNNQSPAILLIVT